MSFHHADCARSPAVTQAGIIETLRRTVVHFAQTQRLRARLARERRQLDRLDDHQLRDIGIGRAEAEREAGRRDIPLFRQLS